MIQSTLVISKSKGLSEVLQDIHTLTYQLCRIEEKLNNHISQMNMQIENIVEKWRNCSLRAISPLFHKILLPVVRFPFSMLKQAPDFHFKIRGYWR